MATLKKHTQKKHAQQQQAQTPSFDTGECLREWTRHLTDSQLVAVGVGGAAYLGRAKAQQVGDVLYRGGMDAIVEISTDQKRLAALPPADRLAVAFAAGILASEDHADAIRLT